MANDCIFCGKSAGSREHIWPQWLLARRDFGPFRLKRAGAKEVILNKVELTTKSVCGNCNNGWMSELEQKVKPILEQMFDGKPVDLNREQQHLIAVWITKIAFLWDSTKGRNVENTFYQLSEGIALATQYQIPQFTAVWIGQIDEMHRAVDGADYTLDETPKRIGGGSSITLTNEHFVAQIVSLRLDETPTGPTVLGLEPKPGDWNEMLIQIWPPTDQDIVHWPPKVSFTNGGPHGYAHLMDRWRTGDKQEKIKHRRP